MIQRVPARLRAIGCIVAGTLMALASSATACAVDSDCRVGDRIYRIALPDAHAPSGAVIWAHGHRGTAAGVMRNGSLRKMLSDRGLALIALQAGGDGWDIPNAPRHSGSTGAAEFAYIDAVIADAADRFGMNDQQLIASGFSAGAMLIWTLACARSDRFAGFVPVSGTYWRAPPATCDKPVASIVHIHGTSDTVVPLSGRPIGTTHQGNVAQAIEHYARFGGFTPTPPTQGPGLHCKNQRNPDGALLAFCLSQGGHSFRTEYLRHGLDALAAARR